MADSELKVLGALLRIAPGVAKWLRDLIAGKADPDLTRRVSEILPEHSASEEVLEELRREQR